MKTYVISYQWKDKPSLAHSLLSIKERKQGAAHHVCESSDVRSAVDDMSREMKLQERKFSVTSIYSE